MSSDEQRGEPAPIDTLPHDVLHLLVDTHFGGDDQPLAWLLPLQLVSKRWRAAVTRARSRCVARLTELHNTAPKYRQQALSAVGAAACRRSAVSFVRWLVERLRYRPDGSWCIRAAEGNQVATLEWLCSEAVRCECNIDKVYRSAASHNSRAVMEWAMRRGVKLSSHHISAAASGGHLELVRWMHEEQRVPLDEFTAYNASWSGRLAVVQYVMSKGAAVNSDCLPAAAGSGSEELVRWLHDEQHVEWSAGVCSCAAARGHLSLLQYVRSRGCPWDEWTLYHAIVNGHTDVLRWALQQGCPTDRIWDALWLASQDGHVAVLRLVFERDKERFRRETVYCPRAAAQGGQLAVLQFLHQEVGLKLDQRVVEAAITSESTLALDVVRYVREEARGQMPDDKWFGENRREIRLEVAAYLRDKGVMRQQ